jgi:hypothetical protein
VTTDPQQSPLLLAHSLQARSSPMSAAALTTCWCALTHPWPATASVINCAGCTVTTDPQQSPLLLAHSLQARSLSNHNTRRCWAGSSATTHAGAGLGHQPQHTLVLGWVINHNTRRCWAGSLVYCFLQPPYHPYHAHEHEMPLAHS